jgi:hypothetical protein
MRKECFTMQKPLLRKHILTLWVLVLAMMLAATSSRTWAGEQRHHGAHVHGIAHLNVAVEKDSIHLEFTSPAANIVGFEHQPRTPEQKDSVRNAIEKLEDGSKLFIPSPEAQCRLSKSSVKTDIEHHDDHHADAEHKHEHEKEHEHEKDEHHDQEHHKAHEGEHERHSEFHSEYQFVCRNPGKLSQMDVMLIQYFPGIEHIEVQLITETKQSAQELTAQSHRIKF